MAICYTGNNALYVHAFWSCIACTVYNLIQCIHVDEHVYTYTYIVAQTACKMHVGLHVLYTAM